MQKTGQKGKNNDLDAFETSQRQLIDLLAHFKTLSISRHSQLDVLTGLPLRHRMEMDYGTLVNLARFNDGITVMMVDVDRSSRLMTSTAMTWGMWC